MNEAKMVRVASTLLGLSCCVSMMGACADAEDSPTVSLAQMLDAGASVVATEASLDAGVVPSPQVPDAGCAGGRTPSFALAGWATESGGTTGGKGGATVSVASGAELAQALKGKQKNPAPLTILVNGTIAAATAGVDKFDVKDIQNLSIIGAGAGATLDGIGIKIVRARNVVIRNLRIRSVKTGDKDAISIEGPVDHVWIDHNELSAELEGVGKDDYDGLLDAKKDSAYLTYSWNYLHDSWKTSLVGSSESDTFDRKLTIHHNRFERCHSRLPLFRGGNGHVFNNSYDAIGDTGINTRVGACLRVEANVFGGVKNPWISAFSDVLGAVELRCNALRDGAVFAYDAERRAPLACTANVPYAYDGVLTHPDSVVDIVAAHAGVGKLSDPTAF